MLGGIEHAERVFFFFFFYAFLVFNIFYASTFPSVLFFFISFLVVIEPDSLSARQVKGEAASTVADN